MLNWHSLDCFVCWWYLAMLPISTILVLNTLLNTFIIFSIGNNSIVTIYSEFNYIIQSCADIFVLDLLTIFREVRLIKYTNMFSPYDFKKNNQIILNYVKVGESLNIYPNVSIKHSVGQRKSTKLKTVLSRKFAKQKQWISKRLSKCIPAFDYFDKALIVLFDRSGGVSIDSFVTAIGAPVGIASTSFRFAFSVTTGIVKKLFKTRQDKKKIIIIRLLC